jgi:hypothetical protein
VNRHRSVENNFYCVKIKRGATLRDKSVRRNLTSAYTAHGIKTARPLFWLYQGTGEPELKCKAKRQRTCKEMPKVAKFSFGADEVVVANIPKR